MKFSRLCAVLLLPLMLSSCFLVPGAFTSALDLRKDGSFTFAYKGEVIFQSPDEMMKSASDAPKTWNQAKAVCPKGGDPYYDEFGTETTEAPAIQAATEAAVDAAVAAGAERGAVTEDDDQAVSKRPCTKVEIAKLKKQFDDGQAAKLASAKKQSGEFAALFGFSPADDDANRKLAASLMKYEGWKTVTYKGKGVFDVDYSLASKTSHDFLFPLFPQVDLIIPFVQIRKRTGNSVMVNAPALVGGGMKALAARAKAMGQARGSEEMPGASQATRGTFTLTTDAEIMTNNTDDGPVADPRGRRLVWEIDPSSEKIPEALVRLKVG